MHKSVRFVVPFVAVVAALLMAACGGAPRVSNAPTNPPGNPNPSGYPTYTPAPVPQASTACQPAPCAEYQGAVLSFQITNPNVQPGQYQSPPDPGTFYIEVALHVKNGGTQPINVNPYDFKLQDPTGAQKDPSYYGSTCNNFDAESVAPSGDVGPLPMCFNPSGTPGEKLILIWNASYGTPPANINLN